LLIAHDLGQTSLMFIGLPAVLAILLTLAPSPKSSTGTILRGIALTLLFVAPIMGEGYLCILFISPLFFAIGLIVGLVKDRDEKNSRNTTLSCITLVLVAMSFEGTTPSLTFDRSQTVQATEVVAAPASAVEAALTQSPHIATPLPRFLRIGFPRPDAVSGAGLALNNTRTIHFTGAEGDPPGDLVMRVTRSENNFAHFETISDASKLTQWIRWRSSEVTWVPVDATHTRVTWQITFDRQLDPAWYFTPWERIAVTQAAHYLIDANATPRS